VAVDSLDFENGVGFFGAEGDRHCFGHDGYLANGPRRPYPYLDLEQRFSERLGELVWVEIRPNRFDRFAGVEIEVNLTKAQFSFFQWGMLWFNVSLPLLNARVDWSIAGTATS